MLRQPQGSDHALLARMRDGEVDAFETAFRAHHATLCEIVDAYVGSQAVAEEIVQDLFFTIWRDRAHLYVRESLRSYLCAAARNRAVQHLRHAAVTTRWEKGGDTAAVHGTIRGADAELEATETLAALRDAVAELPPRTRLAVALRWRHGQSNAQVAASMGISVKGVEKLLALAMAKLRDGMRSHRREA